MDSNDAAHKPVVLVAIDWYLPAFRAGGPIRSIANLVANLGDRIDFRIVCGDRDLGAPNPLPGLTSEWTPVGQAKVRYLPPGEWTAATWRQLLEDLSPDRLYLNSLYSGPFSRLPWRVARELKVPTTLAPRGMLGAGALSIKPWRKRLWLAVQWATGRYADLTWHASTEAERSEIRRWFPTAHVCVAQNLPVPFAPLAPAADDGTLHLLSVGRVHPIKNGGFALRIAGQLASSERPVLYRIVGPLEDADEAQRLRDQAARLDHVTLELAGAAQPDAVAPHFGWSHLVLVPSFNENFGHAVAEATAAGRPAIVSDQTAWSALKHGTSVRCLPLDEGRWLAAAHDLLAMDHQDIVDSARTTHAECLLHPDHLAAHLNLFA